MRTRAEVEQALREIELTFHSLETDEGGWAILVPELGAKVLAAGVDEENVFWISDRLKKGAWCVGGQRTWLAPELGTEGFFGTGVEDWQVPPELDPGSYRRIETPAGELAFRSDLTINRLDGLSISLSIIRSIRLETVREGDCRPGIRIRIENRLINRMNRVLEEEVGLWSILQAPAEVTGTFLIPINKARPGESYRLYFGELPASWFVETPTLLYLKARAGKWFKIGIPPSVATGTVALLRSSRLGESNILTVLHCQVEPSARYLDTPPLQEVDNGDVLQCYNSPDDKTLNFCELEAHAPAARLAPGAAQSAEIEIMVFKDDSERISHLARNLVSPEFAPDGLFAG
jgi:hypothetical protein